MLVIGLTGGIGSGKSTVADLFHARGIDIVDADLIARLVVAPDQPALEQISAHFGPEILDASGALRRDELRKIVFADASERRWLEGLLHPLIDTEIRRQIRACKSPYCLLVSPLLLETRQRELTDRVLLVDVDRETQLRRTLERDAGSRGTVEAIIDAQMAPESRREAADDILDNRGSIDALVAPVETLHKAYLSLASRASSGDTA
jgi:dephospho-CoA kinase